MSEKYTAEQVLDTLAKVVAGKEDYVYRLDQRNGDGLAPCNYVEPDGSPSCIVGHVIAELDADLFLRLRRHEEEYGSQSFQFLPRSIVGRFDENATRALGKAQQCQDIGDSWGTALIEARNAI